MPDDPPGAVRILRLGADDVGLARATFRVMAEAFEEAPASLSEAYLRDLLARPSFWALAALDGDTPVGGLTAHTLPMTRSESAELFVYDLAVDAAHRRRGVGRMLVGAARDAAAAEGVRVAFVPADDEDAHAVRFYHALGGAAAAVTLFTFE